MATFLYDFSKTKDKDNELSISSNLAILLLILSSIFGYTEKEGVLYIIIEILVWLWALVINCRLFIKNNIEGFNGNEYEASTPDEIKLNTVHINDIESDGDVKL
ncbi:MAG: hypothetical protein E6X86_01790 [Clostridium butyricum]|nr:hypothetical protein [Clostridium butyricum]MDU4853687.1 hypothetical protein [Clostridioides difficile]